MGTAGNPTGTLIATVIPTGLALAEALHPQISANGTSSAPPTQASQHCTTSLVTCRRWPRESNAPSFVRLNSVKLPKPSITKSLFVFAMEELSAASDRFFGQSQLSFCPRTETPRLRCFNGHGFVITGRGRAFGEFTSGLG